MDGFVLPPFESTSILKDKDIICARKKRSTTLEIVEGGDGDRLAELEFVGNQNVKLLANEEFEKETGAYESEKKKTKMNKQRLNSVLKIKLKGAQCRRKERRQKNFRAEREMLSNRSDSIPIISLITDGTVENERQICDTMKSHLTGGGSSIIQSWSDFRQKIIKFKIIKLIFILLFFLLQYLTKTRRHPGKLF